MITRGSPILGKLHLIVNLNGDLFMMMVAELMVFDIRTY